MIMHTRDSVLRRQGWEDLWLVSLHGLRAPCSVRDVSSQKVRREEIKKDT